MFWNKQTKRNLAILLIAMALLGVTAAAWATHKEGHNPGGKGGGKPGGGDGNSVDTGTIYYGSYGLWSMNPDGSGKTLLPVVGGVPSIARYPAEADRWFLQVRGVPGTYPITAFRPEYYNYEWRPGDLETVGFTGDPNSGAWTLSYTIMIESIGGEGEPDTFEWHAHSSLFRDTNDIPGGDITGDDQEVELLVNGSPVVLTINFGSTTGHNIDDWWEIYVRKTQRSELFAAREDGQIEVQLTDDPNVQLWSPNGYPRPSLRWATHDGVVDGKVSYLAQRWGKVDGKDVVLEGSEGLYEAEVDWATLTPDTTPTKLPVSVPMGLGSYDWSPDGTQIVYSAGGIWVADAYSEGAGTLLFGGYGPQWSPVLDDEGSTLIAFRAGADIRTISPDGGPATTVVTAGKNRSIRSDTIYWSPNGTHLVYTLLHSKGCIGCHFNDSYDIYRVGADGSDPTNLTNDVKKIALAMGWRD